MGKKRQFIEEEVLDKVSNQFWKHGFFATKVDQLSDLTGLTKTSLYNAFGNKEALFLSAINFYVKNSLEEMANSLDEDMSLSKNLENLLNNTFLCDDKEELAYGCFLTNSILELNANELGLHAEVTQLCDMVAKKQLIFFANYVNKNKIVKDYSAQELTDHFMTFWQGLRVQSRNHDPKDKLKKSIQVYLKFIKSIELR